MGPYRHYSFESQTSQLEPSLFSNLSAKSLVFSSSETEAGHSLDRPGSAERADSGREACPAQVVAAPCPCVDRRPSRTMASVVGLAMGRAEGRAARGGGGAVGPSVAPTKEGAQPDCRSCDGRLEAPLDSAMAPALRRGRQGRRGKRERKWRE